MWKALYDYNGEFPGSLSIKTNDKFLLLRKENEYWNLVARPDGLLGCVPVNYLTECSISESKSCLLDCINTALKSLKQDEAAVIHNRDKLIEDLLQKKSYEISESNQPTSQNKFEDTKPTGQLTKKKSKRAPPVPPVRSSNSVSSTAENNSLSQVPESAAPVVPPSNVPAGLAFSLLESLRVGTGAPHKRCLTTLQVLLDTLTDAVPNLRLWTEAIEAQLKIWTNDSDEATLKRYYEESADWENLTDLFHYFEQRKNDSQERSWALHEQETDLVRKLGRLYDTLNSADLGLVRHCLRVDEFKSLTSLIQLYQMERRLSLRRLYLRIFLVVCKVEARAISVCLYSVLPLEIIRDLADTATDLVSCTLSQLLLTLLMANSQHLPTELTEKLTVDILALILSRMNSDMTNASQTNDLSSSTNGFSSVNFSSFLNDVGENGDISVDDLCHSVSGLLLAYNCHLDNPKNNRLMQCLRGRQELARHFTEKAIQAFNREEDPACIIKPESSTDDTFQSRQNSVRKFLCDLYASPDTADLVYRNDTAVIIDVINRQLCDLAVSSPELSEYLVLLDLIATNSDYKCRGAYKQSDLQQSLRIIASQDDDNDSVRELAKLLLDKLN